MEKFNNNLWSDNPLISIGFPVYNGEKKIDKAIQSLLSQTYKNFEIIISDNASTDDTQSLCLTYMKSDKRIRYIRQPHNMGARQNFEFVLNEAVGEFFMWAADDDIKAHDCLEYYLNNIGEANGFYSTYALYNHATNKIIKQFDPHTLSGTMQSRIKDGLLYFNDLHPSLIYGMFRTKLLKSLTSHIHSGDWFDARLVTNYIILYGFKTQLSEPKIFFGFDNDQYIIKPFNRRFLNPFPFILGTFKPIFLEGGLMGWYYYLKQISKVILISLKFNLLGNKDYLKSNDCIY